MNTQAYVEAGIERRIDLRALACDTRDEGPAEQAEAHASLAQSLAQVASAQGNALLEYGGRLIAIQELCYALAAVLPLESRVLVKQHLRERIERVLALTDENAMPGATQSTLLGEVNYFIRALDGSDGK